MLVTCPSPAGWRSKAACATTKNCFGGLEALLQSTQIEKKEYHEYEMARHSLLPAWRFAPDVCGARSRTLSLVVALGDSDRRGLRARGVVRAAQRHRSICGCQPGSSHCHGP